MINQDRHLREFFKLLSITSESFHEAELAEYLFSLFSELGYSPQWDNSRAKTGSSANNLLVKIPGTHSGPLVMFNAHMDTVVGGRNIRPQVRDGYVYSDGTTILGADDKAGIAAIIETVRVLSEQNIPHGELLLCFTTAEEVGLVGAKQLELLGNRPDYCYVLDCGGDIGTIIGQAPYQETFTVQVFGKAAHAGIEPEKGINAIQAAGKMLAAMPLGRIDQQTTANVGLIKGGAATNIVPEFAVFNGEVRSMDPVKLERHLQLIQTLIAEQAGQSQVTYSFSSNREYNGYQFLPEARIMSLLSAAMRRAGFSPNIITSGGGSDANVFNAAGVPAMVLGIGMEKVHTKDECISLDNLNNLVGVLVELARGHEH